MTVAYLALLPDPGTPRAGSAAAAASWQPVAPLLTEEGDLTFDHAQLLTDGVERARGKLEYTPLATAFVAEPLRVGATRRGWRARR